MTTTRCKQCGLSIEQSPLGRPSQYCGVACRRAAEFAIKRIVRQLESLESRKLSLLEPHVLAHRVRDMYGRTAKQRLEDLEIVIALTEERLKKLLSDEDSAEPPAA